MLTAAQIRSSTAKVPAYLPAVIDVEIDGKVFRFQLDHWHAERLRVDGERPAVIPTRLVFTAGEVECVRAPGESAPIPDDLPRPAPLTMPQARAFQGWKTRKSAKRAGRTEAASPDNAIASVRRAMEGAK